mgnify:FL=1
MKGQMELWAKNSQLIIQSTAKSFEKYILNFAWKVGTKESMFGIDTGQIFLNLINPG